ncbi:MAG: nucleotide exchange factor GrpE [Candidatus Micrarchaeia archaeon]
MDEKKEQEKGNGENVEKRQESEGNGSESQSGEQKSEEEVLKDRLLRLAAEFDNYKKRVAVEIEGAKNIGKAEILKGLLPIIDEFELAIDSMPSDNIKKGIELIYSNFIDLLESEGLKCIDTSGKYDPYVHEIITTRESDKKEGTILETVRKGYTFNNILLRPAAVVVSKSKEEDSAGGQKGQQGGSDSGDDAGKKSKSDA